MFTHVTPTVSSSLKQSLRLVSGLLLAVLCVLSGYAQNRARIILDPNRVYKVTNDRTGRTLEVGGGGNLYDQGGVYMWDYWGGANQQWIFEPIHSPNDGVYLIRNRDTKKVLTFNRYDVTDPTAAGSISQENVVNGIPSNTQQWIVESQYSLPLITANYEASQCRIRLYSSSSPTSPVSTGMEQTDWGRVESLIANSFSSGYNLWNFSNVSTNGANSYTASHFQIINSNSGQALSVDPSDNSARYVLQTPSLGRASQEWSFVPSTTTAGYYYIVSRRNGLVLDIRGAGNLNGNSVDIWENNQNPWQEWAFLDINDSHILTPAEFLDGRLVSIYTRHAGKILEIGGGSTSYGAMANIWVNYATPTQQWRIRFSAYNRPSATVATETSAASLSDLVILYPNPALDKVAILVKGDFELDASTISLTDARGSNVTAHYKSGQLDVSGLATGLYFVTISDGKHTIRQKFTKL